MGKEASAGKMASSGKVVNSIILPLLLSISKLTVSKTIVAIVLQRNF